MPHLFFVKFTGGREVCLEINLSIGVAGTGIPLPHRILNIHSHPSPSGREAVLRNDRGMSPCLGDS